MSKSNSVIISAESHPKEIEKNQMLQLSARFFSKQTLALMEVSKIYMTITSLNDGHVAWPLEVIRKNTSGFDIGIGTKYLKAGHDYLVRVSNNYNLSPSASTIFTIKKEKDTFTLNGRGYGHHLGLCQWGAREMVRDGWDYRRILKFYYPGITFKKIII